MKPIPIIATAMCVLLSGSCTHAPVPEPLPVPAITTRPKSVNEFAFMRGFRIAHYLVVAAQLQAWDSSNRAVRLRELAGDPQHASEVYPLCRMLFDAKPGSQFRRPMIGFPIFFDGSLGRSANYADWPLEPIALVDGVPILIVQGYMLAGRAEPPLKYVDYCLKSCRWRDVRFVPVDPARLLKIVDDFIAANPRLKRSAEWLERQAG